VVGASVPPVANFNAAPTSGFAPLKVVFTDSSTPGSGPITNRYWIFGDGNTTNTADASVTNTYAGAGTYDVSLTVTDTNGLSASVTNLGLVSVATVPEPNFKTADTVQVDPGTGAAGLRITGTNGVQYLLVYKDDLLSTNDWLAVDPPGWVSGTNGTMTLTDPGATNSPQRFYKLEAKSADAP